MAGKRLDSLQDIWVNLKDIEEGEGFCGNKSNAWCARLNAPKSVISSGA